MLSDVVQGMLALEERAKAKDHTPLLTSTTEEGLPAVQGVTTGHWCDGGVGVEELRAGWQSVVQHVENAATIPLDRMQPDKMTPEQGSAVLGDACFITFRCAPAVCTPQRSMHMCTAAKPNGGLKSAPCLLPAQTLKTPSWLVRYFADGDLAAGLAAGWAADKKKVPAAWQPPCLS